MSDLPRYRRTKVIWLPLGDHSGIESWPEEGRPTGGAISRRSFVPSWSITQISSVPDGPPFGLERTKAIVSLFGDQAGRLALSASLRRPLRSTFNTQRANLFVWRLFSKAIPFPSGHQAS